MPSAPDDRVGFSLQIHVVRLTMVGVKVTDVRHVSMSTRLGNSGNILITRLSSLFGIHGSILIKLVQVTVIPVFPLFSC